jgi:hypothetical protein
MNAHSRIIMRCFTGALLIAASLQVACSYISNFVVLNDSNKPIEVRYKIRDSSYEPFQLVPEPGTASESNLSRADNHWQPLSSQDYHLGGRTVTLTVQPHEGLRVESIPNYPGHEDTSAADRFQIDEIIIAGGSGELRIHGEETRIKFVEQSESLYLLRYR